MTPLANRNTWLLGAAALIIAAPLLLPGLGGEFKGTDDRASKAIAESNPGFEPWFKPIWEPPSGEVASLLFSLQAALGAGLLGYVIGRRRSRNDVAGR